MSIDWARAGAVRTVRTVLPAALAVALSGPSAVAQMPASRAVEAVSYTNPVDGTRLTGWLALPGTAGPHPGIVVLSIAGTDPLVDRLVDDGYAVLTPERRGFVDVEPLLRATYVDLSQDVLAALDFLRSRDEVDPGALVLIAQGDDTPPAMLAVVASAPAIPLVLLAPPALSGVETFRLEQRGAALRDRARPDELEALDRYVEGIAEVVLGESEPYLRAYRLESLRSGSPVQLPRSAAFPSDERQMHFFASPLWHDRLAFEPREVFARLRARVLVLIGSEDANTPMEEYLASVRSGLEAGPTTDATVCLLPGRTRHAFTEEGVSAIAEWLSARVATRAELRAPSMERVGSPGAPGGCLEAVDR